MKRLISTFALISLILLLASACSDTPAMEAENGVEVISLQTSPELERWLSGAADCAEEVQGIGIAASITPGTEIQIEDADLTLRLGERLETDPYVVLLGTEQMSIVGGDDVPVGALSMESIRLIYTGEVTHWADIPEVQNAGIEIDQPIPILSYPDSHQLAQLFQESYLGSNVIKSGIQVFTTPAFLAEFLQEHPYGIGYLLSNQVPVGIRELTVTDDAPPASQYYVLAITSAEPEGKLRQLLLCMQEFGIHSP